MGDFSPTILPAHSTEHRDHELIFQATGEVIEKDADKHIGNIRVIQGPKYDTEQSTVDIEDLDKKTEFYGFISINNENIPLLPGYKVVKWSAHEYDISIPDREFKVIFEDATDDELLEEFENILVWFCKYEKIPDEVEAARRLEFLGDDGVATVDSIGNQVQYRIATALQPHLDAARAQEGREISIGGKTTENILGKTREIVGKGADAGNRITDLTSQTVGTAVQKVSEQLSQNPLPPSSKRFRLAKTLNAGLVAAGKVYVAADEKGRAIIQTTGDSTEELLYEKYGEEVANAAKVSTNIAVDTYQILRFPANFAFRAVVGGVVHSSAIAAAKKSEMEKQAMQSSYSSFDD